MFSWRILFYRYTSLIAIRDFRKRTLSKIIILTTHPFKTTFLPPELYSSERDLILYAFRNVSHAWSISFTTSLAAVDPDKTLFFYIYFYPYIFFCRSVLTDSSVFRWFVDFFSALTRFFSVVFFINYLARTDARPTVTAGELIHGVRWGTKRRCPP